MTEVLAVTNRSAVFLKDLNAESIVRVLRRCFNIKSEEILWPIFVLWSDFMKSHFYLRVTPQFCPKTPILSQTLCGLLECNSFTVLNIMLKYHVRVL